MKSYLAIFAVLLFSVLLYGCLNSNDTQTNHTTAIQQIEQQQNTNEAPLAEDNFNDTIQDVPDVNPSDYDKTQ